MALGYIPGRPVSASDYQINSTKRQEQNGHHVSSYLHTTGSNKNLVARPEQQGILSTEALILIIYYKLWHMPHGGILIFDPCEWHQ